MGEANNVEIGRIPPPDENVSGAKAVKDRALETLIRRVEDGVSDGIIVYKTSRFARNQLETLLAAKRLKDAGARLVGVADGVDTDQPAGKLVLSLFASMAENEYDELTKGWKASVDRAMGEGKHVACRAPRGYLRTDQAGEPPALGAHRLSSSHTTTAPPSSAWPASTSLRPFKVVRSMLQSSTTDPPATPFRFLECHAASSSVLVIALPTPVTSSGSHVQAEPGKPTPDQASAPAPVHTSGAQTPGAAPTRQQARRVGLHVLAGRV